MHKFLLLEISIGWLTNTYVATEGVNIEVSVCAYIVNGILETKVTVPINVIKDTGM